MKQRKTEVRFQRANPIVPCRAYCDETNLRGRALGHLALTEMEAIPELRGGGGEQELVKFTACGRIQA